MCLELISEIKRFSSYKVNIKKLELLLSGCLSWKLFHYDVSFWKFSSLNSVMRHQK